MTAETSQSTEKAIPSPSIPRRYWVPIIATLVLGGVAIGVTQAWSSDAYLRSRLIGRWQGPPTFSLDLRSDGTCNNSFFGVMSIEGVWEVERGFLKIRGTHGGNTFTDMFSAPERWMYGRDLQNIRMLPAFIDGDHFKTPNGDVWQRVKQ